MLKNNLKNISFECFLTNIRPQDTILASSLLDQIATFAKCKLRMTSENIPVINGMTLFYSSDFYKEVKRQYFIGATNQEYKKHFNIKLPFSSEEELFSSYSSSFRRNVRKGLSAGFSFDVFSAAGLSNGFRDSLYDIYLQSVRRIQTYALPKMFFRSLFDVTGVSVFVYCVYMQRSLVAFQLVLGDILYISGSRTDMLKHRVAHFLTHTIYLDHLLQVLYQGTGFIGTGIDRYKKGSGVLQIPCVVIPEPIGFKFAHYVSRKGLSKSRAFNVFYRLMLLRKRGILDFMPFS